MKIDRPRRRNGEYTLPVEGPGSVEGNGGDDSCERTRSRAGCCGAVAGMGWGDDGGVGEELAGEGGPVAGVDDGAGSWSDAGSWSGAGERGMGVVVAGGAWYRETIGVRWVG